MGLVRSPVHHYRLGRCSALVVCGRRSRQLSEGEGRFPSPPPLCPPFLSRSPRCVSPVVLSGCLFPSPAGTPFYVVCAFRGLGPVALWVRTAYPLCVCVRSCTRDVRAPRPRTCGARIARGTCARRWYGVPRGLCPSAFPAPVPCSAYLAPFGGDDPAFLAPCLALGRSSPRRRACVPGAVRCPGECGGGVGGRAVGGWGGLRGAAMCSGGQPVGHTGRPGAPSFLRERRHRPAGVRVAACGGYRGSGAADGQGARGVCTRRRTWSGVRPRLSQRCGVRKSVFPCQKVGFSCHREV